MIAASSSSLLAALQRVARATPTESPMPVLTHARLWTDEDGEGYFSGTDLEVSFTTWLEGCQNTERKPLNVLIPLRKTIELVQNAGDVIIEMHPKDGRLRLNNDAKTWRYELNAESVTNYPKVPELDEAGVECLAVDVRELLKRPVKYSSSDKLRPQLTGVFLRVYDNGTCNGVATSGAALLETTSDRAVSGPVAFECVIPKKAALLGVAVCDAAETEARPVKIACTGTMLKIWTDRDVLTTKLIEETFPNYKAILPSDETVDLDAVVDRHQLTKTIRRVKCMSNEFHRAVVFSFGEDTLTVSSEDIEHDSSGSELLACFVKPCGAELPFVKRFDYRLLLDALADVKTSDVQLAFYPENGDHKPLMLINPTEQEEFIRQRIVIAPLKDEAEQVRVPVPEEEETEEEEVTA